MVENEKKRDNNYHLNKWRQYNMAKQNEPPSEEKLGNLIEALTKQTETNKELINALIQAQQAQQAPQQKQFDMDEFLKRFADTIDKLQKPELDVDKFSKSFASHIAGLQSNIQKEYSNITQTTSQNQRRELKNKLSWGLVNSIRT